MAANTKKELRNQVIYSVYVRNYSEEGTFQAVEKDLERMKGLGVDIVWLMPIHPTGEKNRKGELGSPYAIRNYREVNPELGTIEDLKSLVNAIHEKGMKCIMDVVFNHTSPDSWLTENHPEYFYKKADGSMGNRVGDWSDIVDFDFHNKELWNYHIETLKMWAQIFDGFRCDVAPLIPIEFWREARKEVEKVAPDCFWLSESTEPHFLLELRERGMVAHSDSEIFQVFDACYEYDTYSTFRKYLDGECELSAYAEHVNMQEYIYPDNYVKLRFLENHDQDRAKSIIKNQQALINWTAFCYFQKGMTLIYNGQETENYRRTSLFDKDTIAWNTGEDLSDYLANLYEFKKNPILKDSRYSVKAYDQENILVGMHRKDDEKIVGIFNFEGTKAKVDVELCDGIYRNIINQTDIQVEDGKIYSDGTPVIIVDKK